VVRPKPRIRERKPVVVLPGQKKTKPINIREALNKAADVARDIVETLGEKTRQRELLDPMELANYKLALDALKTCRELYLRTAAMRALQRDAQPVLQPLEAIDSTVLVKMLNVATRVT